MMSLHHHILSNVTFADTNQCTDDDITNKRVLQFAYHKESLKKAREYKGKTVNLTASNIADIGILCSWYTQSNSDRTFILNTEKDEVVVHQYQPTSSYLCTLTHDSFETTVCEEESSSFMKQNESKGIAMHGKVVDTE